MKKGILWMLIIAMMVGACLPVSADKVTAAGEASAPVNGKYEASNQLGGIVFSVDLEWEGMEFTYHEEVPAVWDAEEYTYHAAIPAHWEGEGTITVTNHSNAVVRVVPSYEANVGFESAEMKFFPYRYLDRQSSTRRDGLWLHSAAIIGEADSGTITVTPSGTLPSTATETTQIGTLTVTLSAPELVWDDMDLDATLIDTEAGSLLTPPQRHPRISRKDGPWV